MVKNDSVKVTFYYRRVEYDNMLIAARYLYEKKAIPRPTVGTYSRAAALKMFKDLSILTAKEKEEADLKSPKHSQEYMSSESLPSESPQQ